MSWCMLLLFYVQSNGLDTARRSPESIVKRQSCDRYDRRIENQH